MGFLCRLGNVSILFTQIIKPNISSRVRALFTHCSSSAAGEHNVTSEPKASRVRAKIIKTKVPKAKTKAKIHTVMVPVVPPADDDDDDIDDAATAEAKDEAEGHHLRLKRFHLHLHTARLYRLQLSRSCTCILPSSVETWQRIQD